MSAKTRRLHKRRNWAKHNRKAWVQSRVDLMRWAIEHIRKGHTIVIDVAPCPSPNLE